MTVTLPPTTDVRPGDQQAVRQIEEWFRTWQATGDPAVRERIILAHLGLAERLASRFRHTGGVGHEDLVQAARVGLVTAVNRYDPDRGNSFIVYAIVCITGELRRCLRDTSWRVHVARTLKERALQVVRTRDELTVVLERSPTLAEIGARLGLTEEHVVEALEAIDTRCRLSLDEPVGADGTTSLGALLPAPTGEIELEDRLALPVRYALERTQHVLRRLQAAGDRGDPGILPDPHLAAAAPRPQPDAAAAFLVENLRGAREAAAERQTGHRPGRPARRRQRPGAPGP